MTPDDPRHGTYAGVKAHARAGIAMCDDCFEANYIYSKRMRLRVAKGERNRLPLGDDAWEVLTTYTGTQLAEATGINRNVIYRLQATSPEKIVTRATRDAILGARWPWTTIGIQRRVQALYALGWTAAQIGRECGVRHDPILRLMQRDAEFVRHEYAAKVVEVYERLAMAPAPESRAATRIRRLARERGYVPPLAWDDIDTDEAPVTTSTRTTYPAADLVAEYEFLTGGGVAHGHALEQLGVSDDALERARYRATKRAESEAA